ncbi:sensor histidine kinase [Actinomadura logoneensis]|uniref:histidine kinase n=1 Tax=Actinomadura logoneensis TaxID=2293572 RepID=A0A372JPC9_9ACTN|nr:HAMP domain-containing sensor histidine kinase [Actinomadura logoneensis]RFU41666.1 sensor histidine kinase [Actinomadura logoneensis]
MTSLRMRMAAAFAAVALLASVLASGVGYVLVRDAMLERTQDAVVAQVRQTVARLVPARVPTDAGRTLSDTLRNALSTTDGRQRAYVETLPLDRPVPPPPPGRLHVPVSAAFAARATRAMVVQRVRHRGRAYLLVGTFTSGYVTSATDPQRTTPPIVLVSVSLDRETADLRSFTRAMATADAAALLFGLALALVAARGVLRPVRRLGTGARALAAGELATRVEVRGRDELADLARTFNQAADALETTVSELRVMEAGARRFVADVSHELRTPLTSMTALTDVLEEDPDGTAARLMAAETRRLGVLVEHLIEISRFDAGAAALVLDDVVVAAAVAATLQARGWSGRVAVEVPDDLVARLDPRRFDVVVANLVGNAFRHGRPPVRLEVRRAEREDVPGFELVVADAGPGIPAEMLPVVFDRFVKADAARTRSEGSGLGLAIARENALLHGGTLEASAGTEGGAVFTLWLPLAGAR